MKKKPAAEPTLTTGDGDLLPEYRFDYGKAKPNRFAAELGAGTVAIVLDPDVAAVFPTSESVNQLLRAVIAALPPGIKG